LEQALKPDERDRANRFMRHTDRSDFISFRGWLRSLLGAYLGVPASAVSFRYGPRGKPYLETHPLGLEFNLSHSGPLAVLALSATHAIGVDIECERRRLSAAALARRAFPPSVADLIATMPVAEGRRAFFDYWTRLEACTKAMGDGIFDTRSDQQWQEWETVRFEAAPGYPGAVALPAGTGRVRWRFLELLL